MTCACFVGYCPLCAGVTYRSPLAHRGGGYQHIPVRPAQAHSLPAERLSAGQEPDAVRDLRINRVVVHALSIDRSMDDVSQPEGEDVCRYGQ